VANCVQRNFRREEKSTFGPLTSNVARLEAIGATEYRHRPASKDILATCPLCSSKLVISDSEKYLVCFGPPSCAAHRAPFDSILIRVR